MKKHLTRLAAAILTLALLVTPASALTVDQALELLEENYYFDIPEEAYEAEDLDELFQYMDPYTVYMSAEELEYFLELVEDTVDMVGIGVVINFTEEGMLVTEVRDDGGALKGGLQAGDIIVAVDGQSCVPAGPEHRDLVLGEEGSEVTLTVLRDGKTLDFVVTRGAIYIPNTEISLLENGVGYVDCNSFGLDTAELLVEGIEAYDDQVSCWLLDLRDNSGGYVNPAVDMMAALNGPGSYLYFEEHDGYVTAFGSRDPAVTRKPLILLVDGGSASASELVSAGIRDTGRGILIGSRTFGKGVAQSLLSEDTYPEYFDGDCIKVTTARFYAAGGSTTDRVGVIPTLLVEDGYAEAVALALTGGDKSKSTLCLVPGEHPFYVDPETPEDVLKALLEAVPPQIPLFYSAGGTFFQFTPAQVAEKLGLEVENRWFTDVADSPYEDAIQAMGVYRLLNGTAPGQFSPQGQLTRAQLCVMLARALNVTYLGSGSFSDVPDDAWYAGAVNAMAELELVNGVGDGRFDPDSPVTQQQFLTIMGRAARYINLGLDEYGWQVENTKELPLQMAAALAHYADWAKADVAVLAWARDAVLDGHGDLLYTSLSKIDPSAPVLREEAAAEMYEILAGLNILP